MKLGYRRTPDLLPGETILYSKPRIWVGTSKSLPSYRCFTYIPILQDMRLYVTNRRILFCASMFFLDLPPFTLWYSPCTPDEKSDSLQSVSEGRMRVLGPYLETQSKNPKKQWMRSIDLRIRIFTREANALESVIRNAMQDAERSANDQTG